MESEFSLPRASLKLLHEWMTCSFKRVESGILIELGTPNEKFRPVSAKLALTRSVIYL